MPEIPPGTKLTTPGGTDFLFEDGTIRILGRNGTEASFPTDDFKAFVERYEARLELANPISASMCRLE